MLALKVRDNRIEVHTNNDKLFARRVVVATGAWFPELVGPLDLPIRVQRSAALYFAVPDPTSYSPERLPAFIPDSASTSGWGVPAIGNRGLKLGASGEADKPWLARPEDNCRPLDVKDIAPAEAFCRRALPQVTPRVVAGWPCMNLKTPDLDFIVGTTPRAPHLILAGGCSGHGFKHAAAVGDIVADLALDGSCDISLEHFSPDRFTKSMRT